MSFLVPCFRRPDFERYATSKSQAQMFLNGSLLTDTLRDLYDLVVNRNVIQQERFILVMFVVSVCFTLEIIGLTFSIILMLNRYPSKPVDRSASYGTDVSTVEGGPTVEMEAYTNGGSTTTVDSGKDFQEIVGRTPFYLKSINDGLTIVSLLLVVLYTIKSAFYPDETRFLITPTIGTTTSPP